MSNKQIKGYIIEEIQFNEDLEYNENILYLELNMFKAFSNIYDILKQLQNKGYNIDEIMKELISFYHIAKSKGPLRARRMYKKLYDMLNEIKDSLCDVETKEQLDRSIHEISATLGSLITILIG